MSDEVRSDTIYCTPTEDGHCITCSDEALPATVLQINRESGSALVTIREATEEIDITLVDDLVPGDVVLVHGGVAIALVTEASNA
jgi:hydrogenase maturation factor